MDRIPNIHPGEILREEFLDLFKLSAYRLAKETHMPVTRISEIIKCRRRITPDTALRLARFFGNSAEFWLGLQMEYDLREEKSHIGEDLETIHTFKELESVS